LATIQLKREELVLDSEKEGPCDNTEASEGESLNCAPQWDGNEETLDEYLLNTRIWKAKQQQQPLSSHLLPSPPMGASSNSASSWVQPVLPTVRPGLSSMDTSFKNVHSRDEQ
jgi:hypothetical protein